MDVVLLLFRTLLAGIFALAGATKLLDLGGSKRAMQDFGVPAGTAMPAAVLLSLVELAIAAFLLPIETSWYAAIAALVLLAVFVVQMGYQLAQGNAPDCHCFGQVYSEPVSLASVVRNFVFAVPAIVLVASGGGMQGMALTDPGLDVMQLAFGVVIVGLLVAAVAQLRRILKRQDEIVKRLDVIEAVSHTEGHVHRDEAGHPNDGMPIGAVVADFEAKRLDGAAVTLEDVRANALPVMFLYVSPTCRPCEALLPEFAAWQEELAGKVDVVFITSGTEKENGDKFGDLGPMLIQEHTDISDLIGARWTPTAVLMGADGRIASHAAPGDIAIRDLVGKLMADDAGREFAHFTNGNGTAQTLKIGQAVKGFAVVDIDGRTLTDADLKGKDTLVTFWSTGCSHCSAMLPDLRDWDSAKNADEPNLLVFSDGDEETLRELGLISPIVLDEGHRTAATLGMFGTPSAVLVNKDGVIVTETAIGAPNIWSLIGKRK
ncbi:MAG: redoxin domain-containing protein [Chloracidobacterium sp.]|nr:redoxin domain-containing protein [Chloracidobacterium sp.]